MLIFASLAMILIFNSTHLSWVDKGDDPSDWFLLPEASMILTLDYPAATIERTGPTWRVTASSPVSQEEVQQLVLQWQGTRMKGISEDEWNALQSSLSDPLAVVRITLAGQVDPLSVVFYQARQLLFVQRGEFRGTLPLSSKSFLLPQHLIIGGDVDA